MGISMEISKTDTGYEITIFDEGGYAKVYQCNTKEGLIETISDYIKWNDYFKEVK